jgi:hypothetical protein
MARSPGNVETVALLAADFGIFWSGTGRRPVPSSRFIALAMNPTRARILWSNPGNPPDAVAGALGMTARRFSRALHKM